MLRVGLTGGIGAGKSAVARYLAGRGAVIVDSDVLAREVVAPGTEGLAEVVDTFGDGVLRDGALDRAALAAVVFADPSARARLERIIHPRVRARSEELTAAAGDSIVVNDIPLLVEVGLAPTFPLVLVVEAGHDVRLARLVERGLPPAEAESRMAAQASDGQRRAAADVVVDNSGTLAELHTRLATVWDRFVGFDENLAAGRRAARPVELTIAAPDGTWPEQYARLAARIRHAAGDLAVTLDHIGSTSVPGLPAKDILDIQLGVTDLAAADRLAPVLAAVGFPANPGEWWDNPKPPDTTIWYKRLHGSADPGRPVNLHVRTLDSPGWRWALMFRDWLRANPAEVAGYAQLKARLAAEGLTVNDYADAKEPWFDEAGALAEKWAATTGWAPTAATG
ncbi:dephospho-CoA kinase [Longispora fulva]|uniref:Dephospho-CoA kinase n=1 Tax=Longispora fulva TaxID=619741 RepID=A0A8J7KKG6_9ACTN|nr:dephospho-CoA kinase [Longispora fulva]MBG6141270.1 dephospho-CoA kinase [Longispora fulva]GIG62734.1 dephospho-CoA kinase [Longispora fulva]